MRVRFGSAVGLLLVSAVLVCQSLAWDPTAAASARDPSPAAEHRLALGVSRRHYADIGNVDEFTQEMGGRTPATWTLWSDWLGPNAAFPDTNLLDDLWRRKIVPLVFWEPDDPTDSSRTVVTFRAIAHGLFDPYLHSWARAAAQWGGPIIVRFAHEMDGTWFPWSANRPGNAPRAFVRAWRHIWSIFKGPHGEGASNVRFLWSPFAPCVCATSLYPGDEYVDYVGFTGLNWANAQRPWAPMARLFANAIRQLRQFSSRPIVVPEAGSVDQSKNGRSRKAGWIVRGYTQIFRRFPNVVLVVYLDIDLQRQARWSLTSPPDAQQAYASLVAQPEFQGSMLWATRRHRPKPTPSPTPSPTATRGPTPTGTPPPSPAPSETTFATAEPTVEPTPEITSGPTDEPFASPSEPLAPSFDPAASPSAAASEPAIVPEASAEAS